MKVIEIVCEKFDKEKENAGIMLDKVEREIIYQALKEYTEKHKRKTKAKNMLNYLYKHMPV